MRMYTGRLISFGYNATTEINAYLLLYVYMYICIYIEKHATHLYVPLNMNAEIITAFMQKIS